MPDKCALSFSLKTVHPRGLFQTTRVTLSKHPSLNRPHFCSSHFAAQQQSSRSAAAILWYFCHFLWDYAPADSLSIFAAEWLARGLKMGCTTSRHRQRGNVISQGGGNCGDPGWYCSVAYKHVDSFRLNAPSLFGLPPPSASFGSRTPPRKPPKPPSSPGADQPHQLRSRTRSVKQGPLQLPKSQSRAAMHQDIPSVGEIRSTVTRRAKSQRKDDTQESGGGEPKQVTDHLKKKPRKDAVPDDNEAKSAQDARSSVQHHQAAKTLNKRGKSKSASKKASMREEDEEMIDDVDNDATRRMSVNAAELHIEAQANAQTDDELGDDVSTKGLADMDMQANGLPGKSAATEPDDLEDVGATEVHHREDEDADPFTAADTDAAGEIEPSSDADSEVDVDSDADGVDSVLPRLQDVRTGHAAAHGVLWQQPSSAAIVEDDHLDLVNAPDGSPGVQSHCEDTSDAMADGLSDDSGSDYNETRKFALEQHTKRVIRHGEDQYSTEEEDALLDEELEDEAVSDVEVDPRHHRAAGKRRKAGINDERVIRKGMKEREVMRGDDRDESEEDTRDNASDWRKVSGPFSKEARAAASALGEQVMCEAEKIARHYGKSTRDVLVHAGLAFKPSRAANPVNKFRQWYSHHHQKPENVSLVEYGKEINEAYKKLFEDIDPTDEVQRALILKPILDFCDSLEHDLTLGTHSIKSVTARMLSAKDQFTALAASYRNLTDMEVVGAILYVGTDAAGCQTSAIFGGSSAVKKLVEDNQVDVRKLIDDLTTAFKAIQLSEGGMSLLSIFGFGGIDESLQKFDSSASKRVPWKDWLKTASTYKLCIVDWPSTVWPPGPDFEYKSLNVSELKLLTSGYIEKHETGVTSQKIPHIVQWSEDAAPDIALSDDDPFKGAIPLVKDTRGNKLRLLRDLSKWAKDAAGAKGKRRKASPEPTTVQKGKGSRSAPLKRCCEESSSSNDVEVIDYSPDDMPPKAQHATKQLAAMPTSRDHAVRGTAAPRSRGCDTDRSHAPYGGPTEDLMLARDEQPAVCDDHPLVPVQHAHEHFRPVDGPDDIVVPLRQSSRPPQVGLAPPRVPSSGAAHNGHGALPPSSTGCRGRTVRPPAAVHMPPQQASRGSHGFARADTGDRHPPHQLALLARSQLVILTLMGQDHQHLLVLWDQLLHDEYYDENMDGYGSQDQSDLFAADAEDTGYYEDY
ncbi:hypothetical protein BKA93DRAFT_754609 [Sparassis latifolia]